MREAGLIPQWQKKYRADVRQCSEINMKQKHDENTFSKLSIDHYSGAFVALLIGYVASLTVFIGEKIFCCFKRSSAGLVTRQLPRARKKFAGKRPAKAPKKAPKVGPVQALPMARITPNPALLV